MPENIIVVKKNNVAYIQLSKNPLNILGIEDLEYINKILVELNADDQLKLIVFESLLKDFSAGMDVKEHTPDKIGKMLGGLYSLANVLLSSKYPTISKVKGACLGGGMEIALLTDMILASENTIMGLPEIKLAHMAPIAINVLPNIVGPKVSMDIILSGKNVSANEALGLNLINRIYSEESFENSCNEFIEELTSLSQAAILANIKAFRLVIKEKLDLKQKQIYKIYQNDLMTHPDSVEGINAFIYKRTPEWKL